MGSNYFPHPQWIIRYAIFLHCIWGAMLLLDGHPPITPWHGDEWIPGKLLGVMFIGVALLAQWALNKPRTPRYALAFLPQQLLLTFGAIGCIQLAVLGHYADGTVVPNAHWHIFADQLPTILTAVFHTAAILYFPKEREVKHEDS